MKHLILLTIKSVPPVTRHFFVDGTLEQARNILHKEYDSYPLEKKGYSANIIPIHGEIKFTPAEEWDE